jgi:hypothetical protein
MATQFTVDQIRQGPPAYEDLLSAKAASDRTTRVVFLVSLCCFCAALIAKVFDANTAALIALDLFLLAIVLGTYRAMVDPYIAVTGDAALEQIYEICASTEEAANYRMKVIAQGREFVTGEFIMFLEWHQQAHRSPAYTKLYDIKQP